jgi:hypothetical protein
MAAELLTRLFTTEIVPQLFPSNSFLSRCRRDDAFVNNNTVELQNAGTLPDVQVDRVVLPAQIHQRADVAHNYSLEELTSDPTLLRDLETLIEMGGMNKRASILEQHINAQNTKMAERALVKWATGITGGQLIPTSGSARDATDKTGTQTGDRKAVKLDDIVNVQSVFHSQDVVPDNSEIMGVAVIPYSMKADLLKIAQFTDADKYGRSSIPSGVLARAFGFDWYVRSSALVLNASNALKAEGAAADTDDQNAAIFYSPSYVRAAVGSIKASVSAYREEFFGHIMSTIVRFGAAQARNDKKGIVLLYEDNA